MSNKTENTISANVTNFFRSLFGDEEIQSKFSFDREPRGTKGRLEKLPLLDLESRDDFLTGFRFWGTKMAVPAAARRFNKILLDNGLDTKSINTALGDVFPLIENDPILGIAARYRTGVHDVMHRNFDVEFKSNADIYLDEMEGFDNIGPGKLELNPNLKIPDYASYEIHTQPGGYVGNPFAGHIYHYSTNNFYQGLRVSNYQDELHTKLANQVPAPEDGLVNRVLDQGCGIGQLAVALKERFSEAEVWGIDVGAPMIRYGHMRAVELDVAVNFSQRLVEDSQFEDNSFDIVTSYILHHELPEDISKKVVAEVNRILRPGGVFFPIDFQTGAYKGAESAWARYMQFKDHRWNEEVWRQEYGKFNFPQAMREAGFKVIEKGPPAWRSKYNLLAVKV
ncbi:MAG: class I SAM-dependent methyltransferase [Pseudomonadota bacterium]|nr:class I SAM-dependent methyltransferase [Pseudomonadota bacterium]